MSHFLSLSWAWQSEKLVLKTVVTFPLKNLWEMFGEPFKPFVVLVFAYKIHTIAVERVRFFPDHLPSLFLTFCWCWQHCCESGGVKFPFSCFEFVVLVRILYQFSHTRYESVYRRCSRCNRGTLVPLPTKFLTLELSFPLFRFSYFGRAGRLRRFCLENRVDPLEAPLVDGNLSGCWRIDKDCRRMCWWRAPLLIILETSTFILRPDVYSSSTLLCHFNCRFINASCLRIISLKDAFLFISKSFSSRSRFSWQFVFLSIAFLTWMLNPRSLFGFLMFRGKQTLVWFVHWNPEVMWSQCPEVLTFLFSFGYTWVMITVFNFNDYRTLEQQMPTAPPFCTHHVLKRYDSVDFKPLHSQQWSAMIFSCSLLREIYHRVRRTWHSLVRWKLIELSILTTSLIHLYFNG